jgi:hypothetical protein
MTKLTFDQLPEAIAQVLDRLDRIEKGLQSSPDSSSVKSEKLLTYKEMSEEFKISQKTLKLLKKSGLLIPLCKGGKYLLFEKSHVIEVLQKRPRLKPKFLS